jgi:hypothetical protein
LATLLNINLKKKNNNHSNLGKKHMEVCDWIKRDNETWL